MAGDWIKVEKLTPDKPELMATARACGCSPGEAFASWFRLWAYFDSATEDGCVRFMSASDADRIGQMSGLGAALERTGWLKFDDDGCHVAKWDRHNGQSAKRRALDTERKADARSVRRPQNVRTESGQNADQRREEEEKIKNTPNPPRGDGVPEVIEDKTPEDTAQTASELPESWSKLVDPSKIVAYVRKLTTAEPSSAQLACWKAAMGELHSRNADPEAIGRALNAFLDADPKFRGAVPDARRIKAEWFLGLVTKYGTGSRELKF
jgi:hypothetical protein